MLPSIFNDVLGPVMRGASSSHCAAALRIGRIARDLMNQNINSVLVEYTPDGSLATTHESQGSDMGLYCGFLGYNTHDSQLERYRDEVREAGLEIDVKIVDYGAQHPNTYKLTLHNETESHELTAISTGGGIIEVLKIDGAEVELDGGYSVTLLYSDDDLTKLAKLVTEATDADVVTCHPGPHPFVMIRAQHFVDDATIDSLAANITSIKRIAPVLPVLSGSHIEVPFTTCDEMLAYNATRKLPLWKLALEYESARARIPASDVIQKMIELSGIMKASILSGLAGTEYDDRILPSQTPGFVENMNAKKLIESSVLNTIISYVSALMEVKSSMGVIVAAPTAGSCGAFPGCTLAVADFLDASEEQVVHAMLVGGLIGVFIAKQATFAAEVGGCQAECGSGAGMAAAALVTLSNGTTEQALGAASMALQNSLGLICDPIGNRVEAPCLGRNVTAASNALSCANMALASYDHLIPLDQVIQTMDKVGKSMNHELLCTALGGLSVTDAAKSIEERLTRFKSC